MIKMIFLWTLLLVSVSTYSQKYGIDDTFPVPKGLAKGDKAPIFAGLDQNGKEINLSDLLKKGKVVLFFYRGYWCPVCNKHLKKFQHSLHLILDKGATVVAVSPEQNDGIEKTLAKTDVAFSVLSDQEYKIMDEYAVRVLVQDEYARKIKKFLNADIALNNKDEKPYLPVPATYIIGMDGIIEKVYFDTNYSNRPTAEEISKDL